MSAAEWTAAGSLAEALCRTHNEDPPEAIPGASDPRNRVAACYECQRRADALAPFVRQAKAEALREAATEFHHIIVERKTTLGMPTDQWLRDRAAREAERTEA